MFVGEYNFNLDNNHRLSIPGNFKKYLESELIVAKSIDKCLSLYNISDWNILSSKINELSITKKVNRQFSRALNSGAFETELDSKGRILIGQNLLDYANITKECVILGVGNRIEIWDKEEYKKYLEETEGLLDELSEELDL